ncbi:hypothetical protein [Sphingobium sp. CFD-2]|uniref:hypothetical protein n=1 Tax=Sphingobium sp. CFD-2 TaxID=2878542 RepID=UPI00214AB2E8|nr:hypothetical protein [Sphingobium sp. CFD-2]
MLGRVQHRMQAPLKWSVRLVLAGIAAALGTISVMQSVALVLPDSRIELAYALAPNNGHVAGRYSQLLSGPNASAADQARAVAVANAALRHDPTAVEAVATLAVAALLKGDRAAAERLLGYSQMLSRRDLRTQLMAIELAVAQGDIVGALRHYDIALRTKKDAPGVLYPVLIAALGDPAIRNGLVQLLRSQPIWGSDFVNHVARSDGDPVAAAAFFRTLQEKRFPVSGPASATITNRLLAAGRFEDAWQYYASFREGVHKGRSRDPNFTAVIDAPTSFDWIATSRGGVSGSILSDQGGGLFDFSISMGNGGIMLQQLQMLPPGDYVLEGRSVGVEQPARSRPYWRVRCRSGREVARADVPNSTEKNGQFAGAMSIPADCPVQILALVARSSDDIAGVSGQITHLLLRPAKATE